MTRKLMFFSVLFLVFSFLLSNQLLSGSTSRVIVSQAASFAPAITYTLTVTIDGGGDVYLNATGPYNPGDVVQLTVYADYGWGFHMWTGDLNGSANPAFLVMNSNKFVTAHFVQTNTLYLTVTTDKYLYGVQEMVNVSGSLYWEPSHMPVANALVGIQVSAPGGAPIALRTRPTGSISGQSWTVNFTRLFTCDQNQVPKSTFAKGEDVWVFAEWKNFDQINDHDVTMTATVSDSSSTPVYLDFSSGHMIPNGVSSYNFKAASVKGLTGNFVVYGSLFSGFPKAGGYPYSPEWQVLFTITASAAPLARTTKSTYLSSLDGTFGFQFRLPTFHGYYSINATTFYSGVTVTGSRTLYLPLIGDINRDGSVDIYDAILLSKAFNSVPGNPSWNPNADLNQDGSVDIYDAILLSLHFLESG